MTPRDLGNIHTTGNGCRDTLPCTTSHKNYLGIFTCWFICWIWLDASKANLHLRLDFNSSNHLDFSSFLQAKDIFVPCSIQRHFVIFSMICFTSYSQNKEKFLYYHQHFTCYTVIWRYHITSGDCALICWKMVKFIYIPSSLGEKLQIFAFF